MTIKTKLHDRFNFGVAAMFVSATVSFVATLFLDRHVQSPPIAFIAFTVLIALLFFAIRAFMVQTVIAPASALADASEACRLGDVPQVVPAAIDEDVSEAVRSLGSLVEKNAAMKKELAQLNLVLEEKVRERTRQSDEANRAKSAFLANMSHELRTPLNAILGFTNIMAKKQDLPEDVVEQLSIVRRSGEYLLLLINDVLDLSKIEAGQMDLNECPLDLQGLLWELHNMFAMKAANKNLELKFDLDEHLPRYVVADELKLRQVMTNFIDNAVKFTSEGGIYFRARIAGYGGDESKSEIRTIRFEVEDTGAGISAEEQKDLFKAFVQTRSGQESKQGTGLGLAISYQFIKLMSGDIEVESSINKGSRFSFAIPLRMTAMDDGDLPDIARIHPGFGRLKTECRQTEPDSAENSSDKALVELPPEMLEELEEAARICSLGEVESCIVRIRRISPKLALELEEHASEFNYDLIVDMIRRKGKGVPDENSREKAV